MKERKLTSLMRRTCLPAVVVAVSLGAHAQTSSGNAGSAAGNTTTAANASRSAANNTSYRAVRASQVIGMNVRNEKGENLGEISDMVVNMNTGDVRYAILTFDPGIFKGERLFAVPTTELRMAPDRNHVVYRMSKDRLEQTAINRSDWNSNYVNDTTRMGNLDRAWGIRQPSQGALAYRASDLLGKDIRSRAGEEIGEVDELVIDMANRKVHYAVMDFDVGWATPGKRVIVPLQSFDIAAGRDELVFDVDKSRLQALKDFSYDRYSNLGDRVWVVDVDRYLVSVAPGGTTRTAGASGATAQAQAQVPQRGQTEAMERLQQAAQRLRESIQAVAQKKPGSDRDHAIDKAHEALLETQRAMVALPPEMRSSGSSGNASTANYDEAVRKLMQAADSLRKSIQAMAQQPAGEARNRAIEQANQALWDTQSAMVSAYDPRRTDTRAMNATSQQSK